MDFFSLTPLLPTTANREQPKSEILIDYSKWNTPSLPFKKGDTDLLNIFLQTVAKGHR